MSEMCRKGLHEMTPENTYLRPPHGWRQCRACKTARRKTRYENDRRKKDYQANREQEILAFRERRRRLKLEAIQHYGGACACCGETELAFLTIDHVNGGGNKHRKVIGTGGETMYRWLRRNGYPKDDFQVLCFNCNHGKWINGGICPHVASLIGDQP